MKVRKLDPEEHSKTRSLWEEVFTEDTKAFLDYITISKQKIIRSMSQRKTIRSVQCSSLTHTGFRSKRVVSLQRILLPWRQKKHIGAEVLWEHF